MRENWNNDIKNSTLKILDEDKKQQLIRARENAVFTYSFAYVRPEIKSKYALIANIKFLLQIYLKKSNPKYSLTNDDQREYEDFLIDGIYSGLMKHYKMDKSDIKFLE